MQTKPKAGAGRAGKRPQKFRETEIARLRRVAPDCALKINNDGSIELTPIAPVDRATKNDWDDVLPHAKD